VYIAKDDMIIVKSIVKKVKGLQLTVLRCYKLEAVQK